MMPEIKNRNLNFFLAGVGGGGLGRSGDMGSAADIISMQAAIPFMYLANQVKINAFVAL